MLKTTIIKSIDDVKIFFNQLLIEEINFHPDSDFNDFINLETLEVTFSKDDAEQLNNVMNDCFEICEKEGEDIYEIALEVNKKYNDESI